MSSNLHECIPKFKKVIRIKDPIKRKEQLSKIANSCIYKALNEIAINTVKKKVPLSEKDKEQLQKDQIKIVKLACYTTEPNKRKRLITQSGGILPILIPAVASILTTLATELIK